MKDLTTAFAFVIVMILAGVAVATWLGFLFGIGIRVARSML